MIIDSQLQHAEIHTAQRQARPLKTDLQAGIRPESDQKLVGGDGRC